jgi:MOSC domain-containing protein YiiM
MGITPSSPATLSTLGRIRSLNVAASQAPNPAKPETGGTGIFKVPVDGPVRVQVPQPKNSGPGQSGLLGDVICDIKHHGGPDQAVYAYAREDLDWWEQQLGRELPDGIFGENLTTEGLNLTDAIIGERWRIGEELVLEANGPRVPCATFAARLAEPKWIKRFTEVGVTGVYLRVVHPGEVRRGDEVEILTRPAHGVTIATYFRAITTQRDRLPELSPAREFLPNETLKDLARLGS